jgi:hypothetical protein
MDELGVSYAAELVGFGSRPRSSCPAPTPRAPTTSCTPVSLPTSERRCVGDAPAGERPFRTHIDPSRDGNEVVSAVADRIRVEFFRRLGLEELLSAHRACESASPKNERATLTRDRVGRGQVCVAGPARSA